MANEGTDPNAAQNQPQGQGPKDKSQPNPAGHVRGNQRPEGMTDEQWEAERERVNKERQAEQQAERGERGSVTNPIPGNETA
jgi:hypothetical protein